MSKRRELDPARKLMDPDEQSHLDKGMSSNGTPALPAPEAQEADAAREEMSQQEVQRLVLEDRHKRQQACQQVINEAMARYRCGFEVVTLLRNSQLPVQQINIVALD